MLTDISHQNLSYVEAAAVSMNARYCMHMYGSALIPQEHCDQMHVYYTTITVYYTTDPTI